VFAASGVLIGWIGPWMLLLLAPLLMVGLWLTVTAARDRNRHRGTVSQHDRCRAGVVGVLAMALVDSAASARKAAGPVSTSSWP
jgi:hypothetical protein